MNIFATKIPGAGNLIKNSQNSTSVDLDTSQYKNNKDIAHELANDIVDYLVYNTNQSGLEYAPTLRRTVKEIIEKHNIVFKGMIKKLKFNELESSNNICECLNRVFNEMFIDNNINWGRIVTVYSFAALTAKHCNDIGKPELKENISAYVGNYISQKCGQWIEKNGGWDAFVNYFKEEAAIETKIWQGLLYTFLGLGALATGIGWNK